MRTIEDYRRHLQSAFDVLALWCQYGEPDWYRGLEVGEIVDENQRLGCRFGCDVPRVATADPQAALQQVGKLLAWAKRQGPYFDSAGACDYLGITEQSLYGLVERKRLKPLRGPRRTYRFTRKQLDDYLAQDTDI